MVLSLKTKRNFKKLRTDKFPKFTISVSTKTLVHKYVTFQLRTFNNKYSDSEFQKNSLSFFNGMKNT